MKTDHRFCSHCGQERIKDSESISGVMRHFLGDYFTFDSKIVNSIKPLLFKPGALTVEYENRRRARYISPLRLYIFVSILFFLILAWSGDSPKLQEELTPDAGMWNSFFDVYLPRVFFVLLPIFALITNLLFRKLKMSYVGHLVFALHFHSFVFIVLMAYQLLSRIFAANELYTVNAILLSLTILWFMVYLILALKRVFKRRIPGTLLRFFVLLALYSIMVFIALISITAFMTLRG
ncbi:MAG: DUF3667 domain-containing protein [Cryomorphaceae bacterium]|nr:DUF3667 domain-containing protein [Flavobacteriales bacterium]